MGDIKIVLTLKGERASVGIQAPECDPVFAVVDGGLERALERLPGMIQEAQGVWDSTPRYPRCQRPPSQEARTQPAPTRVSTAQRRSEQPTLF
jgi:hypothetical protein